MIYVVMDQTSVWTHVSLNRNINVTYRNGKRKKKEPALCNKKKYRRYIQKYLYKFIYTD